VVPGFLSRGLLALKRKSLSMFPRDKRFLLDRELIRRFVINPDSLQIRAGRESSTIGRVCNGTILKEVILEEAED
jgi:hypothetical protein